MLIRGLFVGLVGALLVACSTALASDSGIQGNITAGPSCPVMIQGIPCPDRPYPATLTILSESGGSRIARVTADESGYYWLALAPGTYLIHPESPGVLPRARDVSVMVLPGEFTTQDIAYDTGIR